MTCELQKTNIGLVSRHPARVRVGAAGGARILFGRAGLRLVRPFSTAGYSHAFHGRRGDHVFFSIRHQTVTKISWGYSRACSSFVRLHLHRDNDHPVGVLRERLRLPLRHHHGARIGRYSCGYVYWDVGGIGVEFVLWEEMTQMRTR